MSKASERDPAERDLAWVGYHPRAMAPSIALAAFLSIALWTGKWFLDDLSEFAERVGSLVVFVLAWGIWPALIAILLYRTITYTYRLTDRSILIDFGFYYYPVPAIELARLSSVATGGGWLARRLSVGWVEVRTPERTVRLPGIRSPEEFAMAIGEATRQWKEMNGDPGAESIR